MTHKALATFEDVPFVAIDPHGRHMTDAWKHHICESCYFSTPENYSESGGALMVQFPTVARKLRPRDNFAYCCFCTKPTISGIFIMRDPSQLLCHVRGTHGNVGLMDPGQQDE